MSLDLSSSVAYRLVLAAESCCFNSLSFSAFGLPTRGDVRKITGGRGYIGSRGETEVAKMLRDPAIIRYFMDLYGEAGKKKRAKTTSLGGGSRKEDDCQPDRTGKIPASCKGQKAAYDG